MNEPRKAVPSRHGKRTGKETGREGKKSEVESKQQGLEEVDYDDLRIGKQVGGGGFAIVYEGRWRNRPVALKTLVSFLLIEGSSFVAVRSKA